MKTNKTLTSIIMAGALALGGCGQRDTIEASKTTTFITTAKRITIEPHYGSDSILMDGIVVKRLASGNGLHVPTLEDATVYAKGSPMYEALRPLLTVEQSFQ